MGHRAEAVMLNKGPHIVRAVQTLDDILRRMEAHQIKKQSMMRELSLARTFMTSSLEDPLHEQSRELHLPREPSSKSVPHTKRSEAAAVPSP